MANIIYNTEDDTGIRELINYALTGAGFEVYSFESAEGMLSALERRVPDLIILDIMLPGTNGIEALKTIRSQYNSSELKVLMLTAKSSEINKITGLDNGADDYITKPFSVLELVARVKAHLRSRAPAAENDVLAFGGLYLRPSSRSVHLNGEPLTLTYKEFELLHYLMKTAGTVAAREVLLAEVWGYDYFGDSRTVDIHIKNLRAKLGAEADCIVSVRGVGYVLKAAAPQG